MRMHVNRDEGIVQLEPQTHYDRAMLESLAEIFGYRFLLGEVGSIYLSFDKALALCPNSQVVHIVDEGKKTLRRGTQCDPMPRGRRKKGA